MVSTTAERRAQARRPSPVRVVATVVGYAVPLLLAALLTRPQLFGLSDVTGFLHLSAFPLVRGLCWLGVAVVLAGVTWFARKRLLLWLVLVAVLAGGLDVGTFAARGTGEPLPAARSGDLTVLTINTLEETSTPEEVGRLVVERGAAAVAMPETTRPFAERVAAYLAKRGVRMQVYGGVPRPLAWYSVTSLLVSAELGDYRDVPARAHALDAVVVEPVRDSGPTIAAVHAPPPFIDVSAPRSWERVWRVGAARAAALCRDGRADIVLGDVNATLDHEPLADLGGCVDAASAAGAGAQGTWPTRLPVAFAAPIDHVFVARSSWGVLGTEVRTVGGSDHRALVARLRPR